MLYMTGIISSDGTLVLSVVYEAKRNTHLNPEYVCFGRSEITIPNGASKGTCYWYDSEDSTANGQSKWSLFSGAPGNDGKKSKKTDPKLGHLYTRVQISELVGGGDGQILT
jgi:hypothetical protein